MSGHSKWSTIKRKKGANDAKRGAVFTRLARELTLAARSGGDPETNFQLRLAVQKARAENMPKDNIDRAIKRGTGELKDGAEFEEVIYEAYAGHGIALLISVATDNRNRTVAEIKRVLNRMGGSMAEPGSVMWQFEQKGSISVASGQVAFDDLFMIAADAGAEDVVDDPETIEITTPREQLHSVLDALSSNNIEVESASLDYVPKAPMPLEVDTAMKVASTVEQLEDLDDTQGVYSNLELNEEVLRALEATS